MRTYTRLVTAPASELIDLQSGKDFLRVTHADDDNLIQRAIRGARYDIENAIGYALLPQTYDQFWDAWPGSTWGTGPGAFLLPLEVLRQPLISVTYLKYTAADNSVTTMTQGTDYVVDLYSDPPLVSPASGMFWPAVQLAPRSGVNLRMQAGYTDTTLVPQNLIDAVYMQLANRYENRNPVEVDRGLRVAELPQNVQDILLQYNPPLLA